MPFQISTDTGANLTPKLIRQHELLVLPLPYIIDGKTYWCTDINTFDANSYYAMLKKTPVTTSLVNSQRYCDAWAPVLAAGQDILHVSMSSGISGTCQSAMAAAEQLKEDYPQQKVIVVDSLGAGLGEGLMVLEATRLRAEGKTIEQAEERLKAWTPELCQFFMVDDLLYLKRSGRLVTSQAVIGTLLHIKPLLRGGDTGRIEMIGRVRGRKAAFKTMAERYGELVLDPGELAAINHSNCPEDAALLADYIHRIHPEQRLLTVCYEPAIGSHVGPDAVALFFHGKHR